MDKTIKGLIWLYVLLLIFEGAFRKWWLPGLATPLLIVRDPVVIAIYMLAFATGKFPVNAFTMAIAGLAVLSGLAFFIAGKSDMLVMLYGMRINYLHFPLVWVMAEVLTRRDVERLGSLLLLTAIPMTFVMVRQFQSPMDAYINRGVGGDEFGQLFGAEGKIRPPGFFAFITGPQFYFPLVAAFLFNQVGAKRRMWFPLLIASGLAIIIAMPVSISRTVMIGTCLVGVVFLLCLPLTRSGGGSILRTILILSAVGVGVSFLPIFSEGRMVFMSRWNQAASEVEGNVWVSLLDRVFAIFSEPMAAAANAPIFGHGIGVGSNVGSRLMTGSVGFGLAEDEWSKTLLELGPLLGTGFLGLRVIATFFLAKKSLEALLSRKDNLPILIFVAIAFPFMVGQWAPPTVLGLAVLGAGLLLAACNEEEADDDHDVEVQESESDADTAETSLPPPRVRY